MVRPLVLGPDLLMLVHQATTHGNAMVKCLFFQDATLPGRALEVIHAQGAPSARAGIQWCCHKHCPDPSGDPPVLACQGETVRCTIPTERILDYRN